MKQALGLPQEKIQNTFSKKQIRASQTSRMRFKRFTALSIWIQPNCSASITCQSIFHSTTESRPLMCRTILELLESGTPCGPQFYSVLRCFSIFSKRYLFKKQHIYCFLKPNIFITLPFFHSFKLLQIVGGWLH